MEGKRSTSGFSPTSSSTSSSSLLADLSVRKNPASSGNSASSGWFNTVFSTTGPSVGKSVSSHSEIFGPYKKQDSAHSTVKDGINHGSPGKGLNFLNKEKNPNYRAEKDNPFPLSSSLYYGGQDFYSKAPSPHTSGLSYNPHAHKEGEEDATVDTRGDWWQGSFYY